MGTKRELKEQIKDLKDQLQAAQERIKELEAVLISMAESADDALSRR